MPASGYLYSRMHTHTTHAAASLSQEVSSGDSRTGQRGPSMTHTEGWEGFGPFAPASGPSSSQEQFGPTLRGVRESKSPIEIDCAVMQRCEGRPVADGDDCRFGKLCSQHAEERRF